MSLRWILGALDGLLVVLFVFRLARLKRSIDTYRPPSPLPATKMLTWEGLTITRVS